MPPSFTPDSIINSQPILPVLHAEVNDQQGRFTGTVKILDRSVSFVYTIWERVYIKSIEGEEYSQHRCNRERDSSAERSPQRINNEKDAEKKVALELPG